MQEQVRGQQQQMRATQMEMRREQTRMEDKFLTYHASPVSEVRDKEITPSQTVISLRDKKIKLYI